jgi:integrase
MRRRPRASSARLRAAQPPPGGEAVDLPTREDRDQDALFPGLTDARLRTAVTRVCKATGTPHFSPHGLRRHRGSLHYKRAGSPAEVAELLARIGAALNTRSRADREEARSRLRPPTTAGGRAWSRPTSPRYLEVVAGRPVGK